MRGNASNLVAAAVLVAITGCNDPKKQADMQEPAMSSEPQAAMEPDLYATDPAGASTGGTASAGGASYSSSDPSAGWPAGGDAGVTGGGPGTAMASAASGGVHTVTKGDTLFSLARAYYNDARRWREIYDANRDKVKDPNVIRVGEQLVIP